jgi:hypothetical protein
VLPAVTGVSPGTGPTAGRTLVKISGSGLARATAVKFGGVAGTDVKRISETELQVVSPPGSGIEGVTVTTPAGISQASSAAQFAYVVPPTITDVRALAPPLNGTLSMIIMITGTGLSSATAVTFATTDGNTGSGTILHAKDSELTVSSPATLSPPPSSTECSNGDGFISLTPTVTTPGGTATTTKAFADKC